MELFQYLILQHPGHNRVFFKYSGELALNELKLAVLRMEADFSEMKLEDIAGVRYLSMKSNKRLTDSDLKILSNLSFVYAVFLASKFEEQLMLQAIALAKNNHFDEKISSLLKYSGKTNELFTRMMLNIALLTSDFNYDDRISILDPVAGRGTTLFEAVRYGYDAFGIEIDIKSVHATSVFYKQYLETERYKHSLVKRQIGGSNKREASYIQEFLYATSKEAFKDELYRRKLGIVAGNSKNADLFFKKNSFHLIVGDLPYGIIHGNAAGSKMNSLSRSPETLLQECLPAWHSVLMPGGAIVLAWNSFLVSKKKLEKLVEDYGFRLKGHESVGNFEHMVDKSIKRDILVAVKIANT